MVSIFATTEYIDAINQAISQEFRLNELVEVKDFLEHRPLPSAYTLIVKNKGIRHSIDWHNALPPYLLPEEVYFSDENLLGLIFAKLGNYEKAHAYLAKQNPTLWLEVDFINRLQNGIPVDPSALVSEYSEYEEYRLMHNQAIVRHYASGEGDFDLQKTLYFYKEAQQAAPNDEFRAFTTKQYATLLTDIGELATAEKMLLHAIEFAFSEEAKIELKSAISTVWMQKLTVPYDETLLAQIKTTLWEVLEAYEKQERFVDAGLILMDASHIANICDSFSESLGYISRAIAIFEEENIEELVANAQFRKGTLLYTWAQGGNPQFYRGAMESYQEALKVFTREAAPSVFADIQHHLGVIYSEIPDEVKKKSIWAAISSSSFQETLSFYTQEQYPYEYAMVCNSYGNALTKYPAAVLSDNYEKALFYYQEALRIRTAHDFPLERAITLLNYIEACWYVSNEEDTFNESRYQDMVAKSEEVLMLVDDERMQEDAKNHLAKLAQLREAYQVDY